MDCLNACAPLQAFLRQDARNTRAFSCQFRRSAYLSIGKFKPSRLAQATASS